MSEPGSDARMEDVLASIRRLVSQQDRPAGEPGSSSGEQVGVALGRSGPDARTLPGGRLMLTPSLRVTDPERERTQTAADEDAAAGAAESDEDLRDDDRSDAPSGKPPSGPADTEAATANPSAEVRDGVELAVAAPVAVVRTAGPVEAPEDRTSVLHLDKSVRLPDDAAGMTDRGAGGTHETEPAPEDRSPSAIAPTGAALDSENLVRTVAANAAASRANATGPHAPAESAARRDGPADEDDPAAETVKDSPRTKDDRDTAVRQDDALETKIAALEAAIARRDDRREPDGVAGDAHFGKRPWAMDRDDPTRATREDAPYLLEPEARRDVPVMDGDSAPGAASSPAKSGSTVRPDEDALRAIMADVVRQELQGALGERITRNVRKLVRREILRALASRDFD